jgi:hypothetical protein
MVVELKPVVKLAAGDLPAAQIIADNLDVPFSSRIESTRGHGSYDELPPVNDHTLVLEPAPAPVVVEPDDLPRIRRDTGWAGGSRRRKQQQQ